MTAATEARAQHPDFPWLAADDRDGVARYLQGRGWLAPDEEVITAVPAGDGNMNLTLRVRTTRRGFILKQARPWVEKYPEIAAPWDRAHFEQRFYERAAAIPELSGRMPALLEGDREARVLLLEDIAPARDRSDLYAGAVLEPGEIRELAGFLAVLHAATRGAPGTPLRNPEMRRLNHSHVFEIPLAPDNGLDLDVHEPGLGVAARALSVDAVARRAFAETGERYLQDGPCLLHGDYFPGSWLFGEAGLRVIDPEFCFDGPPEVDLGCALAHLALARQPVERARQLVGDYELATAGRDNAPTPPFDEAWLARFAAAEVMRRLIGVAQLPIPPSRPPSSGPGPRAHLLEQARGALLEENWEALWA